MPEQMFTQSDIDSAIQQAVDRAVADQRESFQKELADMRASMAPLWPTSVPAHSGGPGTDIQPTWSLYDQGLATAGEHPLQQQPQSKKK